MLGPRGVQCLATVFTRTVQRSFSLLSVPPVSNKAFVDVTAVANRAQPVVVNPSIQLQQQRTYKMKDKLKLRCAGCYFVRRHERLFVECTIKPRHKQAQKVSGMRIFKEDYCKGRWRETVHWNWMNAKYYQSGKNGFSKVDWLDGRIGKDI